ncbi:MAG TPA: SIMPL domain-containing protein [Pyrinomonadaceae bacterium]|nr:SIMPL domain-containing protein [Pyrinomonadaceae bacterium]
MYRLFTNLKTQRASLLLLILLIATTFSCASCSRKTGPTPTKVTVIGDATINTAPDAAVIVLSVVTQAPQAVASQQQNAGKTDAVIKAIKDAGGASAEVKTNGYNLQPQQSFAEGKVPKIGGYETRNSLMVTLSDLTKVGTVIDAATNAGANSIDRVSFIVKDRSKVGGQSLAEATSEAMTKARSIAQAMGGRVIRLVEEQEVQTGGPGVAEQMYDANTAGLSARTPVQAGPIRITSRVQLIVEVEAQP